ncbi:peptidase M16 [Pelagivirga sediminicola]|uniref:Peptidase M16 n=1 Tax=Pelagivirga sediminicola TaxID=2170575 RepID=A0A2T7G6E1_9RHOB|nr:pitrilysin family protein [Pelagivirga sediminicola]PVA09991.1 peptidase M16 [Pelagivirga sediminicola]
MRALTIALAALLPLAAAAQDTAPDPAPETVGTDNVTIFTLANGLDLIVIEDHRAPVVTHMVWYRAGSADEPPGASGVAHFLEHLLFKGTDTLAPGEFSSTVAKQGGNDNAFTSYDYTAYFQRVAADRLELMMQMESDRMVNLQLDEQNVATERDVIIEERNMRVENDPGALFREQKNAAQFLNSPYGDPVIGWKHEQPELTLQDARDFYGLYYAPNNAIVVVAGDVDPEDVHALTRQTYGALPANPDLPERIRPEEPRQLAARRLTMQDPRVAQPYVARSYLAPERDSGDQARAAALTVLAEILGGGTTSLMAERLQFDEAVAVQSAAWYDGISLDKTTFEMVVVPVPGVSLAQAEAKMDEVIAEFLENGVDSDQLERIKMQVRAAQIYARDDVSGLANRYGGALASGLTVADVQAWPGVLQDVTAEDVLAAARDLFDDRRSVTGYLTAPETAPQPEVSQ